MYERSLNVSATGRAISQIELNFLMKQDLNWLYESAISDFNLLLLIFITIFLLFLLKFNLILLDFAFFIRHHFRYLLKWCAFFICIKKNFILVWIASISANRLHVCNDDRLMISRVSSAMRVANNIGNYKHFACKQHSHCIYNHPPTRTETNCKKILE